MNVTPIYTLKQGGKNTSFVWLPTYAYQEAGGDVMHIKELQEAYKLSINKNNVGLYFPVILDGKLTISYHRQHGTRVT